MCYCFYRNFVLLAVQVHDREHAGGERAEPAAPGDHQRIHRREDQAARGGIQPHSHQDRRTQGKMHGLLYRGKVLSSSLHWNLLLTIVALGSAHISGGAVRRRGGTISVQ